ncbi:MAG: NAD(P)H-dependent oxidoreductase [Flavobacteriaceae bacterium]|nr:NAD(P)H-dependent oxidoreductase [Flavobacteriaceae bacterium]
MKKIVVFGASSSRNSINKTFSIFASQQIDNCEIRVLDLNDFEMPIYSEDREKESGVPKKALNFYNILKKCDGIIISFAEHNGSYTSAFKNIYDWISVIDKIVWWNKPMLLLSTSEGNRGAASVLNAAYERISFDHKFKIPKFSLPNFSKNFNIHDGIKNPDLNKIFLEAFNLFKLNLGK